MLTVSVQAFKGKMQRTTQLMFWDQIYMQLQDECD